MEQIHTDKTDGVTGAFEKKIPQKAGHKKIQTSSRQIWQGREDADMLIEKQSAWHCRPDGDDDFGSDDN